MFQIFSMRPSILPKLFLCEIAFLGLAQSSCNPKGGEEAKVEQKAEESSGFYLNQHQIMSAFSAGASQITVDGKSFPVTYESVPGSDVSVMRVAGISGGADLVITRRSTAQSPLEIGVAATGLPSVSARYAMTLAPDQKASVDVVRMATDVADKAIGRGKDGPSLFGTYPEYQGGSRTRIEKFKGQDVAILDLEGLSVAVYPDGTRVTVPGGKFSTAAFADASGIQFGREDIVTYPPESPAGIVVGKVPSWRYRPDPGSSKMSYTAASGTVEVPLYPVDESRNPMATFPMWGGKGSEDSIYGTPLFTKEVRQRYVVNFEDGDADSAKAGKPVRAMSPEGTPLAPGTYRFVSGRNGKVYAAANGSKIDGVDIKHSSFLMGDPVSSAGELVIGEGGVVTKYQHKTGHYIAGPQDLETSFDIMMRVKGVSNPNGRIRRDAVADVYGYEEIDRFSAARRGAPSDANPEESVADAIARRKIDATAPAVRGRRAIVLPGPGEVAVPEAAPPEAAPPEAVPPAQPVKRVHFDPAVRDPQPRPPQRRGLPIRLP